MHIYFHFIMLVCNSFWIILLWVCSNFCNFVSNFITNQITSCFLCFLNCFFETVLNASVADCLAWSRSFWLYLPLEFSLIFLPIFFIHIFSNRQKSIAIYKYFISRLNWISRYFLYLTLWLIMIVMFILFSLSSGLEFWSVNNNLLYENSELKVFNNSFCWWNI